MQTERERERNVEEGLESWRRKTGGLGVEGCDKKMRPHESSVEFSSAPIGVRFSI